MNIDSSSHEVIIASTYYKENWIVCCSWELRWSSVFDCRRVDIDVHDESRSRSREKTCHTASDSMISGEMDKIWILHSILCDEIQKWKAFSATPPVRLGVGQNDQKMTKYVEEPSPSCRWLDSTKNMLSNKKIFMLLKLTITDGLNILGTVDQ